MKLYHNFRILTNTGKSDSELNLINGKILFLAILTIFTLLPMSSNAQAWLTGYNYRRALTITNNGFSSVTDYQVKIQLTSSNFNNHYPQANGEDIRITAADGTTILPFWIESWSSNQGVIWTKIPSVPTSTSTIYIYYGNNLATSLSNGTNTFDFFEDNWVINPVIRSSQPSWEVSITYPMVFKEGSTYNMIYDGHGFNESKGLATSTDLINWTPYANNPVIGFDKNGVDHGGNGQYAWGDIIKVGSTYHLYPSKGPDSTVHATSTDLINWTGFTPLTTTDPLGIGSGAAILKEGDGVTPALVGGRYYMVYTHGTNPGNIYMAFSTNLQHWFSTGSPVLTGNASAWDSTLFSPSFIKIGSTYYIYYQGLKAATNWQIGFASAPATNYPNLVTWTKYAGNPVISGNHGWDTPLAIDPEFRKFDSTYYLFYTGQGCNGFATSPNPEGPWSQNNNKWIKGIPVTGPIPTVSGGTITLDSAHSIQTRLSFTTDNVVGFRGNFHNDYLQGYKWAGFINGENAPYLALQVDPGQDHLTFISIHHAGDIRQSEDLGTSPLNGFHNFEVAFSSFESQALIDGQYAGFIYSSIPDGPLPLNFANKNNSNSTFDIDWVYLRKFSNPEPAITTVGEEQFVDLYVKLKVYLQGPYSGGGVMTTALNTNNQIPLNSNDAYSASTYGYTASIVGSIPNANIVDWVLLELRTGTASGTKVATRAAFLKNDGTIVDIDGKSPIPFTGLSAGNYYVVVRHRNHLAVMTASATAISHSMALYNFSTAQSQAYGTNPMVALSGGGFGMIAADASRDGSTNATDLNTYWIPQNGTPYDYQTKNADFNLDVTINATDLNTYWIPNNGKATQVP